MLSNSVCHLSQYWLTYNGYSFFFFYPSAVLFTKTLPQSCYFTDVVFLGTYRWPCWSGSIHDHSWIIAHRQQIPVDTYCYHFIKLSCFRLTLLWFLDSSRTVSWDESIMGLNSVALGEWDYKDGAMLTEAGKQRGSTQSGLINLLLLTAATHTHTSVTIL